MAPLRPRPLAALAPPNPLSPTVHLRTPHVEVQSAAMQHPNTMLTTAPYKPPCTPAVHCPPRNNRHCNQTHPTQPHAPAPTPGPRRSGSPLRSSGCTGTRPAPSAPAAPGTSPDDVRPVDGLPADAPGTKTTRRGAPAAAGDAGDAAAAAAIATATAAAHSVARPRLPTPMSY